jgi:hypothetical protein
MKKKDFEDLKDLLISFKLCFVIVMDISGIYLFIPCTICYYKYINKRGIDF